MKLTINNPETFIYLALSMFMSFRRDSILPDVLFIMSHEQLLEFFDMFGGQKIYIPTHKELTQLIQDTLVLYMKECENKTDLVIEEHLGIDGNKMKSINSRINQYKDFVKSNKLIPLEVLKEPNVRSK